MSGQDMRYREFWGLTVHGMLARLAERYGDSILFTWRRGGAAHAVTYGEFSRDVRRLAARLAALGLQGKPVVIDMRNSYEQVAALFAASSMGAVAAPLSFDLPLEDLRDLIGRIGPRLLICDELDLELVPELGLPEGCALLPCLEGADSAAGVLAGEGPLWQETEGLSPELFETYNSPEGYAFAETPRLSFINWGATAFYGFDRELISFWSMHGFSFTEDGNLEHYAQARELMQDGPAWPKQGSVVELEEYIVVNFGNQETGE